MQTLIKFYLEPIAENRADKSSFAFRRYRRTQDAIEKCRIVLENNPKCEWILEADIKGCFDNISHEWLLNNIPMEKSTFRKILKCGCVDRRTSRSRILKTAVGVSQGAPLSPIFCNMALDGLERAIVAASPDAFPIRYADDFIIVAENLEAIQKRILPALTEFLGQRGLSLSDEKTAVTNIWDGFDFLGFNIRKDKYGITTRPGVAGIERILGRIRSVISENQCAEPSRLIELLNPMILGWANCFRFITEKNILKIMDGEIDGYIRDWLSGKTGMSDHTPEHPTLAAMSGRDSAPYRMIDENANPYMQCWDIYLEERKLGKMTVCEKGLRRLESAWHRQHGICPVCRSALTQKTGYAIHEDLSAKRRGTMLVHPDCHRKLHPQ
jgi:RNA-directed DNA polymerase